MERTVPEPYIGGHLPPLKKKGGHLQPPLLKNLTGQLFDPTHFDINEPHRGICRLQEFSLL